MFTQNPQHDHFSQAASRRSRAARWALLGTTAAGALFALLPNALGAPGNRRPLSDFLDAQGTYCLDDGSGGCFLFIPPSPNYLGTSDPSTCVGASFDYAGLANRTIEELSGGTMSLGTTIRGSVTEHRRPDGRADVQVVLHVRNALTFAMQADDPETPGCEFDFAAPPFFGCQLTDVLAGATPALGVCEMTVRFINTAPGDPLPDILPALFGLVPGVEVQFLMFHGRATGEMSDGTPAMLTDVQSGIFMSGFHGAVGDGFPAERIEIIPQ